MLQETDANAHVLWDRRMESTQLYAETHFPKGTTLNQILEHIQSLRQLGGKVLERKA